MYLSELEKKVFVALMRYVCLFQFEPITCAYIMQSFCLQCFYLYINAKETKLANMNERYNNKLWRERERVAEQVQAITERARMEREDMKQVSDRLEKENGQQPEEKDWTKELWEERCAELKEKLERMQEQLEATEEWRKRYMELEEATDCQVRGMEVIDNKRREEMER